MLRRRESYTGKAGDANARILLPSCFQGRIISRLLSPPRLPKSPKISPSTPLHQPNISQTPSGRIISGCLHSVYLMSWHDFQPMLSSFLPFFHSYVPFPNTCRSDDTIIQSISCNRLHMFLHYFCMDVVEVKWGHQGCGGVTNLIRSSEEFGSGAYGL